MAAFRDVPIEVTLVDGSRWVVYYRIPPYHLTPRPYAAALRYLHGDIAKGRLMPAEDLDRVQRRHSHINAVHIVSVREVEGDDGERE